MGHNSFSPLTKLATKLAALIGALVLCTSLAACGSSDSSSSDSSSTASSSSSSSTKHNQLAGIVAEGTPGQKLTIKFNTPMTVENGAYAILQKGDSDAIKDGNRVCAQSVVYNVQNGSEYMSTWEDNTPDCSIVWSESTNAYYDEFKDAKINETVAIGINDNASSGNSYINVLTFVSQSTDLTKAEGKKVTDVPADLPKVTDAADGKPSIDMNGYKGSDTLVAQDLITGTGAKLTSSDTAVVKYTGWLLDGTQFDSSWDSNTTFDASLSSGVIEGWQQGLVGKTVGSQVLLVVPPDLGYGSTATGSIPANSTLVFVVDILAKY